jgi:hypothetical protein
MDAMVYERPRTEGVGKVMTHVVLIRLASEM